MKFNFKKVASVIVGAVMLGSTAGVALAANYPSPFVVNGAANAAIVTGSNAPLDAAAATTVQNDLNSKITSTAGGIPGEAEAVETGSQKLYIGDSMNTTKTTFSSAQLPTILKSGTVTDDDGVSFAYDQEIKVPNTKIIYGDTADSLSTPVLYAEFDTNTPTYTLKVIFPTAVNQTLLTDEKITLFGKDYVFSGSKTDLTTTKLVLFEKSTAVQINDGETKTVGGHTITAAIEDADTATLTIDGVSESKDQGWSGKLNGVDIYVKNVVGPNVAGTSRFVELYLNSNKITLGNASDEVTVGSSDIDGTGVIIYTSGSKMTGFDITVTPKSMDNAVKYIKKGESFTDPVFGTIKFLFEKATPDLDSADRDYILLKPTGETKAGIKFTNKAGKVYDLDILRVGSVRLNATYDTNFSTATADTTFTYAYNNTVLGVGDYALADTNTIYLNASDYFITCSNEYTQIWRIKTIDINDAQVTVEDQGAGSDSVKVSLTGGANKSTGSLSLADRGTATIEVYSNVTTAARINVSGTCNRLYTKSGAKINLAFVGNITNAQARGVITNNYSRIIIEEETGYNGGEFKDNAAATLGQNISVRFTYDPATRSGKDVQMKVLNITGTSGILDTDYWTDDVGDYDNYYVTKYGTFIKQTGDTDKQVEFWYPEDAMALSFDIGEISPASNANVPVITDANVADYKSSNLIVVGGSCVNNLAAKILGVTYPTCGTASGIAEGKYLIKVVAANSVVANATAGNIAVLAAGYEAADTQKAARQLIETTTSTAVDSVINGPTTG